MMKCEDRSSWVGGRRSPPPGNLSPELTHPFKWILVQFPWEIDWPSEV
jgi:hypothetical protein